MPRRLLYVAIAAGALLVLLIVSQLAVPAYLENRAANRLTEGGGKASVDIDALPAIRLLFNRGQRIEVRGERLDIPLESEQGRVFDDLDRFKEADVRLDRLTAGPLRIARFSLTRKRRGDPYALAVSATSTGAELSDYAGSQFGPFAGFVARILSGSLPFTNAPIPIELDATIRSNDGKAELEAVNGTVAGVPAGPIATVLASAIAARL